MNEIASSLLPGYRVFNIASRALVPHMFVFG